MTRGKRIVAWLAFAVGVLMLIANERLLHSRAMASLPATFLCLFVGAVVCASPLCRQLVRFGKWLYALPSRSFLIGLFILSLCFHTAIAIDTFNAVPRLDDGMVAVFQARIFALGKVTLPQPPLPGYFSVFGIISADAGVEHWCGMYPPGWPALLVPGVWINAPWLVNPVLGAWLVVVIVLLGREFGSEKVARTAGLIALCSPLATTLAATHLSHTATALFAALCLLYVRKLVRTKKPVFGFLAGISIAIAFLCRPLTAAIVGLAIGIGLLFEYTALLRAWRGAVLAIMAVAIGFGLLLAFQKEITGDPFTAGHEMGMPRAKFGFGKIDEVRTHTPQAGLKYAVWRFRVMNDALAGWPIPAFVFALVPFLCGRFRKHDVLLALPYAGLLFAYFFYWYYESYYPARYTFAAWPMLFVLVARGVCELASIASRRSDTATRVFAGAALVSMLFLFSIVVPAWFRRFHSAFGDVEEVLPRVVKAYSITNAIVFMDSVGTAPWPEDPRNNYYATGFMLNDLALKQDVIYANNSREQNAALARHYAGRNYYLYRYDRTRNQAKLYHMYLLDDGMTLERIPSKTGKLLIEWTAQNPDLTPVYNRR